MPVEFSPNCNYLQPGQFSGERKQNRTSEGIIAIFWFHLELHAIKKGLITLSKFPLGVKVPVGF